MALSGEDGKAKCEFRTRRAKEDRLQRVRKKAKRKETDSQREREEASRREKARGTRGGARSGEGRRDNGCT